MKNTWYATRDMRRKVSCIISVPKITSGHWTYRDRIAISRRTIPISNLDVNLIVELSVERPIFLAFFPSYLRVAACNAVSLVTGSTCLFPCEITLLARDYRDRPRGENGFSHYAIMQIPLKSNRGRARYWETVAQKHRRGQAETGRSNYGRDAGGGRRTVEGGKNARVEKNYPIMPKARRNYERCYTPGRLAQKCGRRDRSNATAAPRNAG